MGAVSSNNKNNDKLVDSLVEGDSITLKSLELAMRLTDRGRFLPSSEHGNAYKDFAWRTDNPLPGSGVIHLSAPTIYATVLENLNLSRGHYFLNVGSGTGYLSTIVGFIIGSNGINHGVELHENVVMYAEERVEESIRLAETCAFEWCAPRFFCGNAFFIDTQMRYDRIYCGALIPCSRRSFFCNLLKINGICVMPYRDRLQQIVRKSETLFVLRNISNVSFSSLVLPENDEDNSWRYVDIPPLMPASLLEICRNNVRHYVRESLLRDETVLECRPKMRYFKKEKEEDTSGHDNSRRLPFSISFVANDGPDEDDEDDNEGSTSNEDHGNNSNYSNDDDDDDDDGNEMGPSNASARSGQAGSSRPSNSALELFSAATREIEMATGLRSIRTGRRLRRRPTDHQVRDAERQIYSLLGERVARHRQAQAIRSRARDDLRHPNHNVRRLLLDDAEFELAYGFYFDTTGVTNELNDNRDMLHIRGRQAEQARATPLRSYRRLDGQQILSATFEMALLRHQSRSGSSSGNGFIRLRRQMLPLNPNHRQFSGNVPANRQCWANDEERSANEERSGGRNLSQENDNSLLMASQRLRQLREEVRQLETNRRTLRAALETSRVTGIRGGRGRVSDDLALSSTTSESSNESLSTLPCVLTPRATTTTANTNIASTSWSISEDGMDVQYSEEQEHDENDPCVLDDSRQTASPPPASTRLPSSSKSVSKENADKNDSKTEHCVLDATPSTSLASNRSIAESDSLSRAVNGKRVKIEEDNCNRNVKRPCLNESDDLVGETLSEAKRDADTDESNVEHPSHSKGSTPTFPNSGNQSGSPEGVSRCNGEKKKSVEDEEDPETVAQVQSLANFKAEFEKRIDSLPITRHIIDYLKYIN